MRLLIAAPAFLWLVAQWSDSPLLAAAAAAAAIGVFAGSSGGGRRPAITVASALAVVVFLFLAGAAIGNFVGTGGLALQLLFLLLLAPLTPLVYAWTARGDGDKSDR